MLFLPMIKTSPQLLSTSFCCWIKMPRTFVFWDDCPKVFQQGYKPPADAENKVSQWTFKGSLQASRWSTHSQAAETLIWCSPSRSGKTWRPFLFANIFEKNLWTLKRPTWVQKGVEPFWLCRFLGTARISLHRIRFQQSDVGTPFLLHNGEKLYIRLSLFTFRPNALQHCKNLSKLSCNWFNIFLLCLRFLVHKNHQYKPQSLPVHWVV